MPEFTLVVGYRHTSSWSLRAWLMMRKVGVPYEEVMIRYRLPADKARLRQLSPTAKVPLLIHHRPEGDLRVWDSIAIGEYLAERFPEKGLWPADPAARAIARSVSAEMHSSFRAMRDVLSMDLLATIDGVTPAGDAAADVARVEEIWRECRETYGIRAGGPFLFGRFSIADAMYAPVASRFLTYQTKLSPMAEAYKQAILADPDMVEYFASARLQPAPEPLPA